MKYSILLITLITLNLSSGCNQDFRTTVVATRIPVHDLGFYYELGIWKYHEGKIIGCTDEGFISIDTGRGVESMPLNGVRALANSSKPIRNFFAKLEGRPVFACQATGGKNFRPKSNVADIWLIEESNDQTNYTSLNLQLLSSGIVEFAEILEPFANSDNQGLYEEAEQKARDARLGIWKNLTWPVPPGGA